MAKIIQPNSILLKDISSTFIVIIIQQNVNVSMIRKRLRIVDYTFYFTFNLGSLSQSGARGGLGARGGQGGLWLFCNQIANKKIEHAHKHALRILHNDYESSFQSLLQRSNSYPIHIKNQQELMTELSVQHIGISYENCEKYYFRKPLQTSKSKNNIIWSIIRIIHGKFSLEYHR